MLDFFKGAIFWIVVIIFTSGLYVGFQAGSYISFVNIDQDFKISKEVKYSYHNNIFYKLDKWSTPEDFYDVRYLEGK